MTFDRSPIHWETKAREGYAEGYRNGKLDREGLGYPLQVAIHSIRPGYSVGYLDGYHGRPNQQEAAQ